MGEHSYSSMTDVGVVKSRRVVTVSLFIMGAILIAGLAGAETIPDEFDEDELVMSVHVNESEPTRWAVEHRFKLDESEAVSAFNDLEEDIAEDPGPYRDRFQERMVTTASSASDATGREMTIQNVSVDTETRELPQTYGIVRFTFEWDGFVNRTGDHIIVGDAIAGLFLDETTSLQITWDEELALVEVDPETDQVDESGLVWRGPYEFSSTQPSLTLRPAESTDTATPVDLVGLPVVLGLGVILALIAGVFIMWRSRAIESEPDHSDVGPTRELLSNEEQLLQLLRERGGRMKQQEAVEALGWTDAKTSQVVSDLREGDKLESFRLGRENVLKLPDSEHESE